MKHVFQWLVAEAMTSSTGRAYSRLEQEASRLLTWSVAVRPLLTTTSRIVSLSTRCMSGGHGGTGWSALPRNLRDWKVISCDLEQFSCLADMISCAIIPIPKNVDVTDFGNNRLSALSSVIGNVPWFYLMNFTTTCGHLSVILVLNVVIRLTV